MRSVEREVISALFAALVNGIVGQQISTKVQIATLELRDWAPKGKK